MRSDSFVLDFGVDAMCDSCGAMPLVKFNNEGQILMFCGHHANIHEVGLIVKGFMVEADYREDEQKRSASTVR